MLWDLEGHDGNDEGRVVRPSSGGLRTSHYAACAADGMTEKEIDTDWEQVEKDLATFDIAHLSKGK